MDKRGFFQFLFYALLTIFVPGGTALSDEPPPFSQPAALPPTEVSDWPLTDIGTEQATRPTDTYDNQNLKIDERPDLSQALDTIPGIQARTQGSPTLNIRGSASSARSLVLEDGVPLNFSDGIGYNPLFVADENVSDVVLLKGPTSSLFGHDALAGVLEFDTEKLHRPKFFASEGDFNTQQMFFGAPWSFHSSVGPASWASRFQTTVYETHTDGNFPFSDPREGVTGTRSSDDSETSRATLEGQGGTSAFRWRTFNLFARQIGSTPGSLDFPMHSSFNNWGDIDALEIQANPGEKFSIGSKTAYKYLWQNYSGSSPGTTSSIRQSVSLVRNFEHSNAELFDDLTYETFQASYLPGGKAFYPLNEFGFSGFYQLSETWAAQACLRVSSENGGIVPSVGLVGTNPVDTSWKYFLNYSEGYRPPSITQLFAEFPGFAGNPALTSEHSYEFDVGGARKYGGVDTKIEAFSRSISNIIENQVFTAGTFVPENVGNALAYGFELDAEIPEAPETAFPMKLGASIDYLNNEEVDTQQPVPLSPQFQVAVHAGKTAGPWTFLAQGTYWSSEYDTSIATGQLVTLDDWLTVDFFISYSVTRDVTARLALLDLFDEPKELTAGYPDPQRSFTVSILGYL